MQKYFVTLVFFLLTLSHQAAQASFGFYVGGSAAATDWNLDAKNHATLTFVPFGSTDAVTYTGTVDLNHEDLLYNAEGRLGVYWFWGYNEHWVTAIEGFGGPQGSSFTKSASTFDFFDGDEDQTLSVQQTIDIRYTYGAQVKQGYFFADQWLGYIVLGGLNTFYQLDTNLFLGDHALPDFSGDSTILNGDSAVVHTYGLRFGGGIEKFWHNQLSMTLQATYTLYEDIKHTMDDIQKNDTITYYNADEVTLDPSAFQVSLGINYYFGI